MDEVPWHIVDAAQTVEDVQADINKIVAETIEKVSNGAPLRRMFEEGEYDLPQRSIEN